MSWILAHTFDIIKDLPKYIIKQRGEYYNLLMSLYNCNDIENKEINIIDALNDIFDDKNYYNKINLQVFTLNKQIYDYEKQIITTIDGVNSNVLFYYNFSSEKIPIFKLIDFCKTIKSHKFKGISCFNSEQKPIFIKKRNNILLVYESLHKCKVLNHDFEIYPNMIYLKYKEKDYKKDYKKEVIVPIITDYGNIDDQISNIALPLFYDIITKIYKVQFFDFQFQNEIKTFATNFILMCKKYVSNQIMYHPKQYYLNRIKKIKNKK